MTEKLIDFITTNLIQLLVIAALIAYLFLNQTGSNSDLIIGAFLGLITGRITNNVKVS
jgi:multisubunit Na+/H+ antiporter MnhE subunit